LIQKKTGIPLRREVTFDVKQVVEILPKQTANFLKMKSISFGGIIR
jgi:hypothetical protein